MAPGCAAALTTQRACACSPSHTSPLPLQEELEDLFGAIDRAKLNVNGSSLAAGHPFAATGGRIVAQLAKQLAEKKAQTSQPVRGLISICAAGGQGVTAILEA